MAIKPRKPRGLKDITKNLGREIKRIREGEQAGLTVIVLLMKKDSMQNSPVRVGNLRSGHAIANIDGEHGTSGDFEGEDTGGLSSSHEMLKGLTIGGIKSLKLRKIEAAAVLVSPEYALDVHENPNAGTPGYDADKDTPDKRAEDVHSRVGGYKFLEKASQKMAARANGILAQYTKIK